MPVKIESAVNMLGTLEERLDAFRKTIAPDEGYTIKELARHPAVNGGQTAIRETMQRNGWCIAVKAANGNRPLLLVHPKTLAKHAPKNQGR